MKQFKQILILCCIALLIKSCANVQAPTGGPKDEKAPYLEVVSPPNRTLNFAGNNIAFSFDEYIALSNFNTEVQVNPYINPYDIKTVIKGKKLFLELPKDLRKNTTYNINFGKAITDLHERTPYDSISYTFSTGSFIDTLTIKGAINNNGSTKQIKDVTIGLYPTSDTISPAKDKPTYYKTSKRGLFKIGTLPNDEFQLFAFTDNNSNLLYDSLTEQLAFINHSIYTTALDTIEVTLFKESTRQLDFERPIYQENHIEIHFTKGLKSIHSNDQHLYNQTKNTLRIYPINNAETTSFIAVDSFGIKIDTTFTIFESTAAYKDSSIVLTSKSDYAPKKPFNGIELTADHKIKSYNTDSILIVINGDTTILSESSVNHKLLDDENVIQFFTNNEKDTLSVIIPTNSIYFLSDHYNKEFTTIYYPFDESKYGQITGTIETSVPNYVVYLMDLNNKIISTDKNLKELDYQYVKPGKYQIKVLIDGNNNETYDTGDLQSKTQPEAYYLYPKPIDLKANWEVGNINITF